MNILFLDFDGPLFSNRAIVTIPENSKPSTIPVGLQNNSIISYWKMDPLAVQMLNTLYDYHPFTTVISSMWGNFLSKEEVLCLFFQNGLNLHLHENWVTPRKTNSDRANEISWWIDRNPHKDYIILDDPASGGYLSSAEALIEFNIKPERVFLVDTDNGIDYMTFNSLRRIVHTW